MPSLPLPATLVATRLSHDRNGHPALRRVECTVGPGVRLGVVGPNGVGKSTLLGVLAGRLVPDEGTVRLDPPTATVGLLDQELVRTPGCTVRQELHRRTGVAEAERELEAAARALGEDEHAADRYATALARFESLGAGDLDARLEATLGELGAPPTLADRALEALSGGEAARVGLAAVVLSRFDVTLLDEPTNDLDFDGLARLEDWVLRRTGALVVVSHDRAFLAATVTDVLELDDHDHTGRTFGGGWKGYLAVRDTAGRHAAVAYAVYATRRDDLARRARRERQWATTGVARQKKSPRDHDTAQRDFRINRTERLAARARRTEKAQERLEVVDKPFEGWQLRFAIAEAPRSGAVVARLEGAEVRRGDFVLGPLDLELGWAERVALTGPNGSGKSTLVGALLGTVPLSAGRRWLGPSVVPGVLGQSRHALGSERPLAEVVAERCALGRAETRSLLAKFGLGSAEADRPAATLSAGERTRAELATFAALGVNLLVLDEPTNHLDLPAIEQVEQALAAYVGTLVVVTHDRALLDAVEFTRGVALADGQLVEA